MSTRYLSPYNQRVTYTPRLEELARSGVVFRRHETEVGWSGPAYATLFSGTYSHRHGVIDRPRPLGDEVHLIAESFAAAGWETFFWSHHDLASPDLGYGQGVPPGNTHWASAADGTTLSEDDGLFRSVLDRLRRDPAYRAYIQVNSRDTHSPYATPAETGRVEAFCHAFPGECPGVEPAAIATYLELFADHGEALRAGAETARAELGLSSDDLDRLVRVVEVAYKSAVHQLDASFGRTYDALQARGLLDESLIVFTADHGETMYRRGRRRNWTHGFLVPEVVEVPLIVRLPGEQPAGRAFEPLTRSVDLHPTLAAAAGVELPSGLALDGADLWPAMRGRATPPRLTALSHLGGGMNRSLIATLDTHVGDRRRAGWLASFGVRRRDRDLVLKLTTSTDAAVAYDLAADPHETRDLFDPTDPAHRLARDELEAYRGRLQARLRAGDGPDLEPEQLLQKLRALGYVE